MRNILTIEDIVHQIELPPDNFIKLSYYDSSEKRLILLTSNEDQTTFGFMIMSLEMGELSLINELFIDDKDNSNLKTVHKIILQNFNEKIFFIGQSSVWEMSIESTSFSLSQIYSSSDSQILDCVNSPDDEHFCLITSNAKIIIMDRLFQSIKEKNLIESKILLSASVTWRFDSKYFIVSFETESGRQIFSFDINLINQMSESTYDPAYPLVRNVFERPRVKLEKELCWTPNGGLIYGAISQILPSGDRAIEKIVSWELNGLFHSQFFLPDDITVIANKNEAKRKKVILVAYNDDVPKENNNLKEIDDEGNTHFTPSSESDPVFGLHKIFWDPSTQYLGIYLKDLREKSKGVLLLYVRSNFVWGLKFRKNIDFDVENCHFESETSIMIFGKFGKTSLIKILQDYNVGEYHNGDSKIKGLVCCVDDRELKMNPLLDFMVPPPMAHVSVEFSQTIKMIKTCLNNILIQDVFNNYFLVQYCFPDDYRTIPLKLPIQSEEENLILKDIQIINISENSNEVGKINENDEVLWQDQTFMIVAIIQKEDQEESMKVIRVQIDAQNEDNEILLLGEINIEEEHETRRLQLIPTDEGIKIVVLTKYNSVMTITVDPEEDELEEEDLEEVQETISDNLIKKIIWINRNDTLMSVWWDENDKLYLDSSKLADDVTSFDVLDCNQLIYTVNTQIPYDHVYLQNIEEIKSKKMALQKNKESSNKDDWRMRNIEKGAEIICSGKCQIVVQLPRGNLETIRHRILITQYVDKLLSENKFKEAFSQIRQNKMSFGLLTDLYPQKFMDNIENNKIISELKSSQLDQLIIGLDERFAEEIKFIKSEEELKQLKKEHDSCFKTSEGKINYICSKILDKITKNDFSMILNEMVTYSKCEPIQYKEGLERIRTLKENEEKETSNSLLNTLKFQKQKAPNKEEKVEKKIKNYKEVLKYFCWLVDAEELFQETLLLFDLDMTIMVAEFTQKDPKEYLPYIQSLKSEEDLLMRKLKICKDLNRNAQALEVIKEGIDGSRREELIKAIVEILDESHLFSQALKIFNDDEEIKKLTKTKLAFKLKKEKEFKLAAQIFEEVEELDEAVKAYKKVFDWSKVIRVMKKMNTDHKDYLKEVVSLFQKKKIFSEIYKIDKILEKNENEKLESLLKAKLFSKAKNTINSIIDNKIEISEEAKRELELQISVLRNEILDKVNNFTDWKNRLQEVQKEKLRKLEQIENGEEFEDDNQSMFSQTTEVSTNSTSSAFSILTGLDMPFGKKRGKKPKNLISRKIKPNSVYEEEWLTQSLNFLQITEEFEKNFCHLLDILIKLNWVDVAKDLLKSFKSLKVSLSNKGIFKTLIQQEFEKNNPDVFEIYSHLKEFNSEEISLGSKQLKPEQVLKKYNFLLK